MSEAMTPVSSLLASRLDLLSPGTLKKIARTMNLPIAANGRDGFVDNLACFIGTERHREVLEKRLAPRDWSLLDLMPLRLGPFRLRVFVVALRDRGFSPNDALAELERLLCLGCVLCASQLPGDNRFTIDQQSLRRWGVDFWFDLAPGVAGWAREHDESAPTLAAVAPPGRFAVPGLDELRRAAFILLTEADRKPIRLTTKWLPYKAELGRLAIALAGGTPGSRRGSKRSASVEAPVVLWFALAALVGARLLRPDGQDLLPTDEATAFLGAPIDQQARRLLEGWVNGPFDDLKRVPTLVGGYVGETGARPIPWQTSEDDYYGGPDAEALARARALIVEALRFATAPARQAWYSIDDFAVLVYRQNRELLFSRYNDYELLSDLSYEGRLRGRADVTPYFGLHRATNGESAGEGSVLYLDRDWREVEGAFVRQVFAESLRWIGMVEVGPDADSPECFRLSDLAQHLMDGMPLPTNGDEAHGRAIVQPNYDVVVVDALANTSLLAKLDAFAERRSLDRAATYRLSQADLVRGLDRGWTGRQVFEVLETANDGPLPQNVAYTLRDWIALYERLAIRERATLLEADNSLQLDGWLADPKISSLLGKRLGPTTVLAPAAGLERLAAAVGERATRLEVFDYLKPEVGFLRIRDPDLIEIAAKQAEPYLVYRLEAFAEPVERDRKKAVYRITRDSVARAIQNGWKGPALAEFLTIASGEELPDDFATRLTGWSGAATPLGYEPLVAVNLPGESLDWYTLRGIASIGRLIRGVPTPTLALVAPGDLDALRAELSVRGLVLRPETLDGKILDEEIDDDDDLDGELAVLLGDRLALPPGLRRAASLVPLFGRPKGRAGR